MQNASSNFQNANNNYKIVLDQLSDAKKRLSEAPESYSDSIKTEIAHLTIKVTKNKLLAQKYFIVFNSLTASVIQLIKDSAMPESRKRKH